MISDFDDERLVRALKHEEEDAATYYDSELAKEQANAMDRYFARPYGDGSEVPNRSAVVTHDIQDALNWVMPHLMRHFTQSDDMISVEDDGLDDHDPVLQDAADLLHHVFFRDNDGVSNIHDFIFDGLLQKTGVMRVAWDNPEPMPPELMEGLSPDQVAMYASDPRYTILEAQIDGDAPVFGELQEIPDEAAPVQAEPIGLMAGSPSDLVQSEPQPDITFSLKLQKKPFGRPAIEVIPPEEFRIARMAKSIERAIYHGWRTEMWLADLWRDHPEKKDELTPNISGFFDQAKGIDISSDQRVTARFGELVSGGVSSGLDESAQIRVWVNIEYIQGDFDGDGVVELRRVKRSGDVVLENDIVSESEFVMWSPIRISHRAIGTSMADTLLDIQRIRTVLTRRAMDSLNQSLMPRTIINQRATKNDPSLLDRLLDHDLGDVIPVDGNPGETLMTLQTPDVSGAAFTAIEYWDRRSEEASGVNRHAMGIQPQAITDTKGGIDALQAAANSRIEQYARWAAVGIEQVLGKVLRLLIKHMDQPRAIRVNGRRLNVDPRRWSSDMTVSVHVGLAAESRERKLMYLNAIAAKQEAIFQFAGVENPLVTLSHYRHTLAQIATAMGQKNASRFFAEIPENWTPPQKGPDPKTLEVQGKLQLAQAEAAAKSQLQSAEFERDMEMQRARLLSDHQRQALELDHRREIERAKLSSDTEAAARKAEFDKQLATIRAENERQIAEMRAANEMQIAQMKTEAETLLAKERMDREMELAQWRSAQQVKVALHRGRQKTKPAVPAVPATESEISNGVRFGGEVG